MRVIFEARQNRRLFEVNRELTATIADNERLHLDEHIQSVDLARYIGDLCTDIKSTMDHSWGSEIQLDLAPILISTDRAIHVGLILTELVINANKYAYAGRSGPITIALEQHRNRFRLIVADRGTGKADTGKGFGSRMLASMVRSLSATLEETNNDPGLRVTITAPLAGDKSGH
jgi:chemotaxis family two-component system sensor kinase Cph1